MWEELLKAIPVYFSSMLKFFFGPAFGYLAKLSLLTTILTTVAGMMTVVVAFAYFGDWLRTNIFKKYFVNSARNTARKIRLTRMWIKYGLIGVSMLTPLLLTPIVGSLLAVSFGSPRDKLIIYMFISASVWSVILTFVVYILGDTVLDFMGVEY